LSFIYVFLGGGAGAMARYGISRLVPVQDQSFPTATFIANFISCIVLGFMLAWVMNKEIDTKWQLLLMTGFCGGFSTFSTFSAETFQLIENGQIALALGYIGASLLLCLVAIYLGIKLGQQFV